MLFFFFFQAEDGIRDYKVTGVQTCALPISVAGLLDDLGIATPHVAGNSLGGWVALELAGIRPVASLTLLSPAGLWRGGAPPSPPAPPPAPPGVRHPPARPPARPAGDPPGGGPRPLPAPRPPLPRPPPAPC